MSDDAARECLAAYDAWAATYDAIDNPLIAEAAAILDEHAASFAGARVVELGCGTGRNAVACLAAGASRYVGVDASPGMLAVARGRFAAGQRGVSDADARVTWIAADLVDGARQAGGGFDLALICLVLEHINDAAPVIAAAAATLAPGGRLLVVELHPALHALGVGANFKSGDREVRLPSFRHDAAELSAAAAAAGLHAVAAVDRAPTPPALARSPKLPRYAGQPVLLAITAQRR